MEIDLTTFVLEIVNFVVLMWLLAHFLYRPVLRVIDERQAKIANELAQAKECDEAAQAMMAQYETRLGDWEREREQARAELAGELREERQRQLEAMQEELAHERARWQAMDEGSRREQQHRMEAAAVRQAGAFASNLLQRLAHPGLDDRLLEMALEDMRELPADRREALCEHLREAREAPVKVRSARDLSPEARTRLTSMFHELCGGTPDLTFETDASLLAGIRVTAGPWTLRANLADELRAFCNVNGYAS